MLDVDIYKDKDKFKMLSKQICKYESEDAFIRAWQEVFGSEEAETKKMTGVVYLWRTSKRIPRLKGESDIIYIGKTVNSISGRHYSYAKIEATGERNKPRYQYILQHYGPISFYVCLSSEFGDDLKAAEKNLLDSYFKHHLEYPPLNRMGK